MKTMKLGKSDVDVPVIAVGCMRMADKTVDEAKALLDTAMGAGLNFFDHADFYGGGKSEEIFSKAIGMNDDVREKIILQSKCGICPGKVMFDFSKEHIIESTEGCLKRLNTDYLDFLLLHRPDTLYEPEEVAEAFAILKESGKVKHFGVSNQNPMQIRLLQKYLGDEPICIDQLQFSITGSYCRWQEISYTQFAEFTLTIEDAQEYVYSISPTKRVRGWRDIEVKLYI